MKLLKREAYNLKGAGGGGGVWGAGAQVLGVRLGGGVKGFGGLGSGFGVLGSGVEGFRVLEVEAYTNLTQGCELPRS